MSQGFYIGVNGKAKSAQSIYIGINNKAKEVQAIYYGVNGKAKSIYSAGGWDKQTPGLFDADNQLLCTWEDSGIDISIDYASSTYKTSITSPYYVITNNYPTCTKIIIPNSITKIGSYAFINCTSLTSVNIPESVTSIGDSAFQNCTSLTSIDISNSVTSIGIGAFYRIPHIYYNGSATGSPWGALAIN